MPNASSTSAVIVWWKVASSASDASDRRRSIDSITSGHRSSGWPSRSNGSHSSSMNSFTNARETAWQLRFTWPIIDSAAGSGMPRCSTSSAARSSAGLGTS